MANHNDFGKEAEKYVAEKYIQNNYKILERNWRFYPLEIDLIAQRGDKLVIVEVKARSYGDIVSPESAVNYKKKQFLIRAANEYIEKNDIDLECRFDIAVVLKKNDKLTLKVYVDAFEPYEA